MMKKYIYNKLSGLLCALSLFCVLSVVTTSCEDMLDKGNEYVIYADDHALTNPADTVTSVLGILNKLQAIAVRTNLLGEVRADLVKVRDNAITDLKDLAELNISDDNRYNVPRDYYAVINNCNYYLNRADSTAGNVNRNEKYFEAEIAQVHSIRAWTYLQLVLTYGKVPFLTDPVLTKLESDAQYPMYDLNAICDYFISDLKPYYGKAYPEYSTIGSTEIDPQMCFYPTQVVMGDLYLWKAVVNHDAEAAKEAAKAYYDYIVWDLNGKEKLRNYPTCIYWSESQLSTDTYRQPSTRTYSASGNAVWGKRYADRITIIPMDSAAEEGYYNDLRYLYNTSRRVSEYQEASIAPSEAYIDLSKAQTYVGYDELKNAKEVTSDKFTEEEINDGYLGDLRYYYNCKANSLFSMLGRTISQNGKELTNVQNRKLDYQNVSIYRAAQLYLRLAEALNYAGYPRFARQILTTGLSNNVIQGEVQPYYTSAEDSAFIKYFDFDETDFKPYISTYTADKKTPFGFTIHVNPNLRTSVGDCNMWGIHGRGSGLPFINANYAPLHVVDSTSYPRTEEAALGTYPVRADYSWPTQPTIKEVAKPSTWDAYPNQTVDKDTYLAINPGATTAIYNRYTRNDSVGKYNTYITETLPKYEADMIVYQQQTDSVQAVMDADIEAYGVRLNTLETAFFAWYKPAYSSPAFIAGEQKDIDQLILDEQALELAFEGNRFYDLMRRAYWYNDNSILANAVSKRDASAGSKLMTRTNWFLNWKGKIGM